MVSIPAIWILSEELAHYLACHLISKQHQCLNTLDWRRKLNRKALIPQKSAVLPLSCFFHIPNSSIIKEIHLPVSYITRLIALSYRLPLFAAIPVLTRLSSCYPKYTLVDKKLLYTSLWHVSSWNNASRAAYSTAVLTTGIRQWLPRTCFNTQLLDTSLSTSAFIASFSELDYHSLLSNYGSSSSTKHSNLQKYWRYLTTNAHQQKRTQWNHTHPSLV